MNDPAEVLALAQARGVNVDEIVVGTAVDVIPQAPSHRWILVPMSDGTVAVGGMDRGSFAVYGRFGDPDIASQVLAQTSTRDAPRLPENRPLKALVTATQALLDQLRVAVEDGTPLTAPHLPVGAVLDHIGNPSTQGCSHRSRWIGRMAEFGSSIVGRADAGHLMTLPERGAFAARDEREIDV